MPTSEMIVPLTSVLEAVGFQSTGIVSLRLRMRRPAACQAFVEVAEAGVWRERRGLARGVLALPRVAKDFHHGVLHVKAPQEEHRVHVLQKRSWKSIVRYGLSPGWAERLGVQLQIPVRARRAACMAGRIRRDGCRRSRASVSSPCPAGAGAPVGACQPA